MVQEKEVTSKVEWRIKVADGSSEILVPDLPEAGFLRNFWIGLKGLLVSLILKLKSFSKKAWDLAVNDPRKVIHCLKAGLALTVVSLFYYVRPLYAGVGGNAMWAVMTVVVVFEQTVGATLYKCLNRVIGTSLAGFLALGVHWLASQSGDTLEPLVVGASVFLLASAATFSRFIPTVKARFDYGAMIFILTFSLVTVSGYRVDKLFNMAHQRILTIIIGTSLCILIIMLVCPIWAGGELHNLITRNMDKLAVSLDACVAEYFNGSEKLGDISEKSHKKLLAYKCVLNSKAMEESMANFARWEPAHGRFNFRHPWRQYLKVGASMRSCAYCIEALNSCMNSENQAPGFIKKHLNITCLRISSIAASVTRELGNTIKTMEKPSSKLDLLVEEMSSSVQELQNDLKSLSGLFPASVAQSETTNPETRKSETGSRDTAAAIPPLLEIIPALTLASLLIEIATRVEAIVDSVQELANLAEFGESSHDKANQNQPNIKFTPHEAEK